MYYLAKAMVFIACLAVLFFSTLLDLPKNMQIAFLVLFVLQDVFIAKLKGDK